MEHALPINVRSKMRIVLLNNVMNQKNRTVQVGNDTKKRNRGAGTATKKNYGVGSPQILNLRPSCMILNEASKGRIGVDVSLVPDNSDTIKLRMTPTGYRSFSRWNLRRMTSKALRDSGSYVG